MGVGGGGWKFVVTEKKCSLRNVPGVLKRKKSSWGSETHTQIWGGGDFGGIWGAHAPTRGSRGVGKRYTSSYDHDL